MAPKKVVSAPQLELGRIVLGPRAVERPRWVVHVRLARDRGDLLLGHVADGAVAVGGQDHLVRVGVHRRRREQLAVRTAREQPLLGAGRAHGLSGRLQGVHAQGARRPRESSGSSAPVVVAAGSRRHLYLRDSCPQRSACSLLGEDPKGCATHG